MDPVSQAVVGSTLAQTASAPRKLLAFSLLGAAAGMAPDLDVLIRSANDPLLALQFHRQFTHALIFIPFGALIVAGALHWMFRQALSFREAYLACLLGYATHGLLDACTSYGTQLLWPFSNLRVSWSVVSVIDPLFTVPALAMVLLAVFRRRRVYTAAAVVWMSAYLLLGVVQHQRALAEARMVAAERGHTPLGLSVKPAIGNLVLWKSIYEHEGSYHVDAVRVLRDARSCAGDRVGKLDVSQDLPWLPAGSLQARDIERFRWFSQDHLAYRETDNLVMDMRYSAVPDEVRPLWGIRLDPSNPDRHAEWWTERNADKEQRARFSTLLNGEGCERGRIR